MTEHMEMAGVTLRCEKCVSKRDDYWRGCARETVREMKTTK